MMNDETSSDSERPGPMSRRKKRPPPIKPVGVQLTPEQEAIQKQRMEQRKSERWVCFNTPDQCRNAGRQVRTTFLVENAVGEKCCAYCGTALAIKRELKRTWFCRDETCEHHDYNAPFVSHKIFVLEKQGSILLAQCPHGHGFSLVAAGPNGFPPWTNVEKFKERASRPRQ